MILRALIDEAIEQFRGRHTVTTEEVIDALLDLRNATEEVGCRQSLMLSATE